MNKLVLLSKDCEVNLDKGRKVSDLAIFNKGYRTWDNFLVAVANIDKKKLAAIYSIGLITPAQSIYCNGFSDSCGEKRRRLIL